MQCVRSISDLITLPGLINLDFADIKTIMENTGGAVMGVGFGRGEGKATTAFNQASSSPLMEEVVLEGAKGVLINITGGPDMTLFEINKAIEEQVNTKVDPEANIIFGAVIDDEMHEQMKVTILATGFVRNEGLTHEEKMQADQLEPVKVRPEEYNDFEEPPYLHKKRPEKAAVQQQQQQQRPKELQHEEDRFLHKRPYHKAEPVVEEEPEPVPFSRADKDDILPSIFGNFK